MDRDNQDKPDKIQAFDTLFTNNHIQMYKLLLPHCDSKMQQQLAVYIKYMEFQYTLTYFKRHPHGILPKENEGDTSAILDELIPYCTTSESDTFKKMKEFQVNMNSAKEMMETMNMMKELFPEGFSFNDENGVNPDIMQMFQMFGK